MKAHTKRMHIIKTCFSHFPDSGKKKVSVVRSFGKIGTGDWAISIAYISCCTNTLNGSFISASFRQVPLHTPLSRPLDDSTLRFLHQASRIPLRPVSLDDPTTFHPWWATSFSPFPLTIKHVFLSVRPTMYPSIFCLSHWENKLAFHSSLLTHNILQLFF